ncbi:hypothetical protein EDC96DRAFT_589635 [Choanephora cucurbitarum]|nr:hypothetical protein EDC96DRAFT_589635 [Choanephora cucurbitarum]
MLKHSVNAKLDVYKDAENKIVSQAYLSYAKRDKIDYNKNMVVIKDVDKCLLSDLVGIAAYDLDNNIMLAKSIEKATTRNFECSIRSDTRKKHLSRSLLVQPRNRLKPANDNILLMFKSDIPEQKRFALIHVYQKLQVSEAGIPFCNGSNVANNHPCSSNAWLEVVPLENLLVPVAMLESSWLRTPLNQRIHFFWPEMTRTVCPIEQYDFSFDFGFNII